MRLSSNPDHIRKAAGETAARMTEAAVEFLTSLTDDQRESVLFSVNNPERMDWDYRPKERKGLSLKSLDPLRKKKALGLLAEGLSGSGNVKALGIMDLEQILGIVEGKSGGLYRDPELYYVAIFGDPTLEPVWGWRMEGHHLSVNYLVAKKAYVSFAPSFFGANPATVPDGIPKAGLRLLSGEEDLARDLVKSMDSKTREKTILSGQAPADIVTRREPRVRMDDPVGTPFSEMDENLQFRFGELLNLYLGRMPSDVAEDRMNRIEKEGKKHIHFAWAGSLKPGKPHYYRVHGPSFLIEYDNVQNGANHIHTVWRDFSGDWGEDLLKEHYEISHRVS